MKKSHKWPGYLVTWCAFVSTAFVALAQTTSEWDGGGADDNWTTELNWVGDAAPVPGPSNGLQFAGSTRTSPTNDFAADSDFGLVVFKAGASAFTVSGNAFDIFSSVRNDSANLQTMNNDITLRAETSFDAAAGNLALNGVISGGQAIRVMGDGTVLLTNANTYSGNTSVEAGALLVNGSIVSDVTVSGPGTLGGHGSVRNVDLYGSIAPGTSPGTISVDSLTLQTNSVYTWEITNATGVAGIDWDLMVVGAGAGDVTNAATVDGPHEIHLVAPVSLPNFDFSKSTNWMIIDAGTWKDSGGVAIAPPDFGEVTIDASGFAPFTQNATWSLTNESGNLILYHTPGAEVATYEWDADAYPDQDWSNSTNWTGDTEPGGGNKVYINGTHTAVVSSAGTVADTLLVGYSSGNAQYTGGNPTGTVEQTGGDLLVSGWYAAGVRNSIYLGKNAGDKGTYRITGGKLRTTQGAIRIGAGGEGTMYVSGVATVVTERTTHGSFSVGSGSGTGLLRVSDTSLVQVAVGFDVSGAGGTVDVRDEATITANGWCGVYNGSLTISNNATVNFSNGNDEQFNSGGNGKTATVIIADSGTLNTYRTRIGSGAQGGEKGQVQVFVKDNATWNVLNELWIGRRNYGSNLVHVGGGLLDVRRNTVVGDISEGHLVVTSGTMVARSGFIVAGGGQSTGTVMMTGGELAASSGMSVGSSGDGQMYLSGGTAMVASTFSVGQKTDSVGAFEMSGGTLGLGAAFNIASVNTNSDGSCTISGGTLTTGGGLTMGNATDDSGSALLHVVGTNQDITIGDTGDEGFVMQGAEAELSVAFDGGFNALKVQDAITVDGTLSVSSEVALADGIYTVVTSLNQTAVSGFFDIINWYGAAAGIISYADHRVAIVVGDQATYEWDAGNGTADDTEREWQAGSGANWTGDTEPGSANNAYVSGSQTAVVASAGARADTLYLGHGFDPNGSVEQTGGDLALGGSLRLGETVGSSGAYRLGGGTLNVTGDVQVGNSGLGVMTITNGTLNTGGSLLVGPAGVLKVVGSDAAITVGDGAGDNLTMQGAGAELQVTLVADALSPILVQDTITVDGALSVSSEVALADGFYVIATSLNQTAVSGTFDTLNWYGQATGAVSYLDNRVMLVVGDLATYEWDAGNGTASDAEREWQAGGAANWTGDTEPGSGNNAYINGSHTAVVANAGARADTLYVGHGIVPLTGGNPTGTVEQTGGDLVLGDSLRLGETAGSMGSYHLGAGTLNVTGEVRVGVNGLGAMTVTNGTLTTGGDLLVATGIFQVVGSAANITIGDTGDEDFTLQNASELQVTLVTGALSAIQVQDTITVNGTLSISSEVALADGLYVVATSINQTAVSGAFDAINWYGNATGSVYHIDDRVVIIVGEQPSFEWDAGNGTAGDAEREWRAGGDANWTGNLKPGSGNDAYINNNHTAVVAQAGAKVNILFVGHSGAPTTGGNPTGTVVQTGGDLNNTSVEFVLGQNAGDKGTYRISGGTLSTFRRMFIGKGGLGEMYVSGVSTVETRDVGGNRYLAIGSSANNTNANLLRIDGGLVSAKNEAYVAQGSNTWGTLEVNGGAFQAGGGLQIGSGAHSRGTMVVGGGEVESGDLSYVGNSAGSHGELTITGGIYRVTDNARFLIGGGTDSTGIVMVSGGVLQNDRFLSVGHNGHGEMYISGVSTVELTTADDFISISLWAERADITNRVQVSGGLLRAADATADFFVGGDTALPRTPALLEVFGGTVDVGDSLFVRNIDASMVQTGGTIKVGGDIQVAANSNDRGTVIMSGGTVTNGGSLLLGSTDGTGVLHVVGSAPDITVGDGDDALQVETGGELKVTLVDGAIAPIKVHGEIDLTGGTLSIGNTGAVAEGIYVVADSLNATPVSGTFESTNWLSGVTGTVSYTDNRVAISFGPPPTDLYADWAAGFGLTGADANPTNDFEGDTYYNLTEYAHGGDPTNAIDGDVYPTYSILQGGELEVVYRRRLDAEARGLSYIVQRAVDPVPPSAWSTSQCVEVGSAPIDAEFESVTNEIAGADVVLGRVGITLKE